jgi:hypothetical protein
MTRTAAEQNQPADFLGPLVIGLEGHGAPHGMPDQNHLTVTYMVADVIEIVGVRRNVDAAQVTGRRRPPVTSVIPMAKPRDL